MLLNLNTASYGFHIKQWVLVTELVPLTVHIFDSFLLKIEGAPWSVNTAQDVSRRLSGKRQERIGSSDFFERYMEKFHENVSISDDILPKLHKIIIDTLDASYEQLQRRQGCYQLLTFNCTLDYTLNPWLLKVSASPFPEEKNPWITTMLDEMTQGLLKIVLEKEETPEFLYDPDGEL